mgnify:CR=1 FL=1
MTSLVISNLDHINIQRLQDYEYNFVEAVRELGLKPEEMEAIIAQESPEVQATIRAVQTEAIAPLQNQLAWLQGFCRLNVETQNISPLLQLLGLDVSGAKLSLEFSDLDLAVIPFRSLTGATWLSQYCQAGQTLPKLESND